jgi:hypothetical protein
MWLRGAGMFHVLSCCLRAVKPRGLSQRESTPTHRLRPGGSVKGPPADAHKLKFNGRGSACVDRRSTGRRGLRLHRLLVCNRGGGGNACRIEASGSGVGAC